jgi:hypothetical protein
MTADRHTLDYAGEQDRRVSRLAATFAFLGGGIAWFAHLLLVYLIGEFGCLLQWDRTQVMGISLVAFLSLIATVLMLGLAGLAILVSIRSARELPKQDGDAVVISTENTSFIARYSVIMNALFLFVILAQAIPIFYYLRTC